MFGDEGSAYWIGRAAVRATLAEYDRVAAKTILTPMLFERLSVTSPYQLTEKYYASTLSRDHLAGLSVWVDEAARQGDTVALEILRDAGRALACLALAVVSLVFPCPGDTGHRASGPRIPVCYAGGVFQSKFVLASFSEIVVNGEARAEVRAALLPPVLGSLLLAYRDAGVELAPSAVRKWTEGVL